MTQLLRDFVKIENDFTIIPNEISRNKEMKSSTKNILIAMLSLPPTWDFSIAGITTCVREGYDTVQKALVELEQMGYITRNREHREDGTFGAMIYTIHQFPVSEEKNTYKNNHKNQDGKTPIQEKSNIGKNQYREKPLLENSVQLSIDNKLNKDSKLSTDKESSTDVKSSIDDKYALEDVKRPSSKGDMYASVPEEHKDVPPKKQSRYIPPDYTEEQLRMHIKSVVENEVKQYIEDMGVKFPDDRAKTFSDILCLFFQKYKMRFGENHYVMPDKTLKSVVRRYLEPPEEMDGIFDFESYKELIDKYFSTDFNRIGKFKDENGKKKKVVLSFPHFMSDTIRGNLANRLWK